MNEHKRKEMKTWLAQKAEQARKDEKALMADDRADEAVFAKIQGNVYDIFGSVLTAGEQACGSEEEMARFFADKLDSIPGSWRQALEKANAHGETEKAHIEELKLSAAAQIRKKLGEVMA